MVYTLHTDGGSRGNPGPSGCAFVVSTGNTIIETGKFYLGNSTNNQAEYMGAILGLEAARKIGAKEIHLIMDSELVIRQLQGTYKVKDAKLKILCQNAKNILSDFQKITLTSVLREKNKLADTLVNEAIDNRKPLYTMESEDSQIALW